MLLFCSLLPLFKSRLPSVDFFTSTHICTYIFLIYFGWAGLSIRQSVRLSVRQFSCRFHCFFFPEATQLFSFFFRFSLLFCSIFCGHENVWVVEKKTTISFVVHTFKAIYVLKKNTYIYCSNGAENTRYLGHKHWVFWKTARHIFFVWWEAFTRGRFLKINAY